MLAINKGRFILRSVAPAAAHYTVPIPVRINYIDNRTGHIIRSPGVVKIYLICKNGYSSHCCNYYTISIVLYYNIVKNKLVTRCILLLYNSKYFFNVYFASNLNIFVLDNTLFEKVWKAVNFKSL